MVLVRHVTKKQIFDVDVAKLRNYRPAQKSLSMIHLRIPIYVLDVVTKRKYVASIGNYQKNLPQQQEKCFAYVFL